MTPSIEKILATHPVQQLCCSQIRKTRPYLKCCYISLQNFLIELLEITDIEQAEKLAFFDETVDLALTQCMAIGIRTNNLQGALGRLAEQGIGFSEMYTSKDPKYEKGFKHCSACLNINWFGRKVYISEYDDQFFALRRNDIATDVEKMSQFSVLQPNLDIMSFCPPQFISFPDGVPELKIQAVDKGLRMLECNWIVLRRP